MVVSKFLFDLFTTPYRLFEEVLRRLRDLAYEEIYDPEKIEERLRVNELLYEEGEITKEEYERRKSELEQVAEIAERFKSIIEENRELYETGKISRMEFIRRRSDVARAMDLSVRFRDAVRRNKRLYRTGKISEEEYGRRKSRLNRRLERRLKAEGLPILEKRRKS